MTNANPNWKIDKLPNTDRLGRRYFVFLCSRGHWHRNFKQAFDCNARARRATRVTQ